IPTTSALTVGQTAHSYNAVPTAHFVPERFTRKNGPPATAFAAPDRAPEAAYLVLEVSLPGETCLSLASLSLQGGFHVCSLTPGPHAAHCHWYRRDLERERSALAARNLHRSRPRRARRRCRSWRHASQSFHVGTAGVRHRETSLRRGGVGSGDDSGHGSRAGATIQFR